MKRLISMLLVMLALLSQTSCGVLQAKKTEKSAEKDEPITETKQFLAEVLDISESSVTVSPLEWEEERRSSDRIVFEAEKLYGLREGNVIRITYNGEIMETHPAQIRALGWEKYADRLREVKYGGEWLDPATAKQENRLEMDFKITQIYADCFFASSVYPLPGRYKFNEALSEEWCVGDQLVCVCETVYFDPENERYEADPLEIRQSTLELEPGVAYKPVIYLYPEEETRVSVRLQLSGCLTCTYPSYRDGWQVTAFPDGTLTDAGGQSYNYLYWEGELDAEYDLSQGFCVRGEDTAAFLEKALAALGLNRREANEFIVFWLPMMEQNPYNIISFQDQAYTHAAELDIRPAPDTQIRVFMTWQKSEEYVELPEQTLTAPERVGFTVVEWGGTEIK